MNIDDSIFVIFTGSASKVMMTLRRIIFVLLKVSRYKIDSAPLLKY